MSFEPRALFVLRALFCPSSPVLYSGTLVKTGKYEELKNLLFITENGEGAYTQATGWAGDVTIKLKPSTSAAAIAAPDDAHSVWVGLVDGMIIALDSYAKAVADALFG